MKYLSVCSGIEAATVAWHDMGWQPVAFSEIEKFPSQVLQHHYPTIPNVGDMTKYKEWDLDSIGLLVGGTPCQSFSVAGLRKGLDDPRGNLALVYCGILDHFRPKWFVWENVPGVLSSNGGRDFGSFLGALAQLGYGFAYRVLDAQWFGVAQRRRRVFVVGHLGDWRRAAAVLFERESLCRNTPPSRKKREETALCLTTGIGSRYDAESETMIPVGVPEVMSTLLSSTAGISRPGNAATEHETYIPMAPMPINTMVALRHKALGEGTGFGIGEEGDPAYTLTKGHSHAVAQPIAFTRCDYGNDAAIDKTPTMRCGSNYSAHLAVAQPIAFHATQDHISGFISPTLGSNMYAGVAVDVYNQAIDGQTAATLTQACGGTNTSGPKVMQSMAVRRLTPLECERLQGFPDGYTDIRPKGKDTPDGPRYKALGNSMAVPVMKWIGKRIQMVEEL